MITDKALKNENGYRKHSLRLQMELQFMIWPAIIFAAIFFYWPMYGIIMAFQDFDIIKGFFHSPFVGIKFFQDFLSDPDFFRSARNTLGISLLDLVLGFPLPIIFALLLNEVVNPFYKRLVQSLSYLPHFLSWAIYGGLIITLLSSDGFIVKILSQMGVLASPENLLIKPELFWIIVVFSSIIKGYGFGAIIYIAAIASVEQEQYESAVLDGAGRLRRAWSITLPNILGTVVIMMIFAISSMTSNGFERVFVLQNTFNLPFSDTIETYVYRMGIGLSRYSYASAVGISQSVLSYLLLVGANFLSKKLTSKSLF